jgi:methyltransferase (TIGR00027 family)
VIIDRFLQRLIADGVDAVINLGAGLDARPYRMDLPASLEWIEVDHPNIIDHKAAVLKREKPKCKLTRMKVDLADDDSRKAFFAHAAPGAKKVVVLTEGVVPYLSLDQVKGLAGDMAPQKRIACWIVEYFHPTVYPYLRRTVRTMKMEKAPFRFYPDDWYGFFRGLGWVEKETRYAGEIAQEFKRLPPMPPLMRLVLRVLPKKMRPPMPRTSGFVVLQRAVV